MAEKKSKITIGPDGTIHVNDEEKPEVHRHQGRPGRHHPREPRE